MTCSKKNVVLEGCNGAWAQKRYLPSLVEKVEKGEIELWAIDIGPRIQLSHAGFADLWETAQSQGEACYVDKTHDKRSYQELCDISYVFIVTPDQHHSRVASYWLNRLTPEGKIFIEKPLDAYMRPARKLRRVLEKERIGDTVFAFDHYLARSFPFLQRQDRYLKEIGEIETIRCHILEPYSIDPNRFETCDRGVIFDLFCHILALSGSVIRQTLTPSEELLKKVRLIEVEAAQYVGSPISGETFAWIRFNVNNIEIESAVGFCIGTSEEKFMEIHGSNGQANLDLLADEFFIYDLHGNCKTHEKLDSKHVENFLGEILHGREPLSTPGVLDFDAAFQILSILNEAKMRIGNTPEYFAAESVDKILERFK